MRATLGHRAPRAIDADLPFPYDDAVRERLVELVALREGDRAHDQMDNRARRVLRREAVLASLEELGMIERTRGGLPLCAVKEDTLS